MLSIARNAARSDMERSETMAKMVQSTATNLLTLCLVLLMAGALLVSSAWPSNRLPGLFVSMAALAVVFSLSRYLLPRQTTYGLILCFLGSFAAIVIGCWLLQEPSVVLISGVLPLVAVMAIGPQAGILVEAMLIGLVLWLLRAPFGQPLSPDVAWLTVVSGAFSGLVAHFASRELIIVAEWSLEHYDKVRHEAEEVRNRQVELAQTQDDLSLANRELARISQRTRVLEGIAEEARQAKTEFVANVSHELRTPLNMIIGYADLISKSPQVYGGQLPAALLTDIKSILRNAQHLSALVNDVLDLSQVEAGRMAISRDWASPHETIAEALTVVKGLFESKGLYLNSEISPDLPPVYCDQTRIRQVLINLLSNAGRFTERGGVTVRCRKLGGEVIFSVCDSGPGIDPKDQARIFEPFQQANTSLRRQYGGSGLGLTISKQFVAMHGGRMWLESQTGVGTVIYFSLPIESPPPPPAPDSLRRVRRSIVPDDELGDRVRTWPSRVSLLPATDRYVVVDPEQILPRLLTRYFPEATVESMPDVTAAVEAVKQSPAQALILNTDCREDVSALALSSLPYGLPVITCCLPGEHDAAQRLGALEYLIKPVSQENLLATLDRQGSGIKTVLIVDDEEDELHLFARQIESDQRGYRILQVTNGTRALNMLRTRKPDVMLLDLVMPGMDGFQVLKEKQRDPAICDIPVVIISARDPSGRAITSNTFTVTHSGGLSQRDLIACIHALGEILAPNTIEPSPGIGAATQITQETTS
jgi:signal transduction histidine kinase/CheY-like chemotaxis protein